MSSASWDSTGLLMLGSVILDDRVAWDGEVEGRTWFARFWRGKTGFFWILWLNWKTWPLFEELEVVSMLGDTCLLLDSYFYCKLGSWDYFLVYMY